MVVCGDLVNQAGNAAQIAEYQRIAKTLDRSIPLHNVAGNHDVGNEPTPESLGAYRKKFGSDYYVFQHPGVYGIVLNSSLIQHPNGAPGEAEQQWKWLQAQLQKIPPGTRAVVFQHIPWFLKSADEPDDYFNIPLGPRTKYLQLFERYHVEECFAGHYHRNSIGESPKFHVTTTGPVGKPLGSDPSGIRVVTMREGQLAISVYQPL